MRFFRFAGLVATVVVAYAALLLNNPNTLAALPSAGWAARLTDFYPLLHALTRYTALLTSLAAVTFGVLTAPWPVVRGQAHTAAEPSQPGALPQNQWLGRSLILLAVSAAGGAVGLRWVRGQEDLTIHLLWAVGILGYLLGCRRLDKPRTPTVVTARTRVAQWPAILLLLLAALFYFGWQLTTIPLQVAAEQVSAGLQTLSLASTPTPQLFVPQPTTTLAGLSATVALVPAALLTWVDGDLLLSMRLTGLCSALLFGLSVWLVSRELFRRQVQVLTEITLVDGRGVVIHPVEDDGAVPALVATLLVLSNSVTLLFSRHPFLLAAAAVGTLGCWALLRAWATKDRLALGLSGSLLGFAVALHVSSWSFIGAALCWWIGMAVANRGWLPHTVPHNRAGPPADRRFHFSDFLLWLVGIFVVVTLLGLGLFEAGLSMRSLFTANFPQQLTLLTRDLLPSMSTSVASALAAEPFTLFHPWLIPLIALASGSLLFNLDRKQGWLLLSWSAVALLWAGAIALDQDGLAMRLPLLPPLAAALAFALDRLRITLLRAGGGWLQQFWNYGLLGLLLWVAFQNGIAYYSAALHQSDPISALGQTLRQQEPGHPVLVIDPTQQLAQESALAQLRILTAGAGVAFAEVTVAAQLPPALAPGTTVILFGEDRSLLEAVRAQYPQGARMTVRANNANRLLYLYQLP